MAKLKVCKSWTRNVKKEMAVEIVNTRQFSRAETLFALFCVVRKRKRMNAQRSALNDRAEQRTGLYTEMMDATCHSSHDRGQPVDATEMHPGVDHASKVCCYIVSLIADIPYVYSTESKLTWYPQRDSFPTCSCS